MSEKPPMETSQRFPTDVGLLLSAAIAVACTALFYLAISPFAQSYLGQLFAARGWSPYAITLLTIWSYVIFLFKYRALSWQKLYLGRELIPLEGGERIDSNNALRIQQHIQEQMRVAGAKRLPGVNRQSLLLWRIHNALETYLNHPNAEAVREELKHGSDMDSINSESSYSIVRTFVWAIPILGFIGTVIGIGAAVGNFSATVQGAADLDVIKTSLGGVTTGLAISFDTTLLALVMSLFVMFVSSALQKAEETLLTDIDVYCKDHLLRRIDGDGPIQAASPVDYKLIRLIVEREVSRSSRELAQWHDKLGAIGKKVTIQVAGGWKQVLADSTAQWQRLAEQTADSLSARHRDWEGRQAALEQQRLEQLGSACQIPVERLTAVQQEVAQLLEQQSAHMQRLDALLGTVAGQGEALHTLLNETLAEVDKRDGLDHGAEKRPGLLRRIFGQGGG